MSTSSAIYRRGDRFGVRGGLDDGPIHRPLQRSLDETLQLAPLKRSNSSLAKDDPTLVAMAGSLSDVAFYALLSVMLESMVFGIFVVLCTKSVVVLVSNERGRPKGMTNIVVAITLLQLVLIFSSWVVSLSRSFDAFIYGEPSTTQVALLYLDFSQAKQVAFLALVTVEAAIFELFFIYRMFIVWDRRFWICVPPIFVTVISIIANSVNLAWSSKSSSAAFDPIAITTSKLACFSSLCTNLYCCGMVAYRICREERNFRKAKIHRLSTINLVETVHIIVESAALIVVFETSAFVAYMLEAPITFVFEGVLPSMIGISFCLVIIRVSGQINRTPKSLNWDADLEPLPGLSPRNRSRPRTQSSRSVSDIGDAKEDIEEVKKNTEDEDVEIKTETGHRTQTSVGHGTRTSHGHGTRTSHSIHLPELIPG